MLADYTIFKAFTQTGGYIFHTQQTGKYHAAISVSDDL